MMFLVVPRPPGRPQGFLLSVFLPPEESQKTKNCEYFFGSVCPDKSKEREKELLPRFLGAAKSLNSHSLVTKRSFVASKRSLVARFWPDSHMHRDD